jgi:glycosyltransferase involved in cell wall biosynthesis
MRILYISQYFPPEVGATQTRALEMASNLVRQGHQVTVLTEFPNHPRGIIPPQYRGRYLEHERLGDLDVVRTWVFARPFKNFYTRMGFYLSFMLSASIFGSLLRGKYDVVYATSPPFFVGAAGLWLSRWKNAKFVFEVRDVWPQSAVELGELHNPLIIRLAEWLENAFYEKAERIIAVTQGIYDTLAKRGFSPPKLRLVLNGTNTEVFANRGNHLKARLGLQDKFTVLYAGIFGIAQGMEQLVDLVECLKSNSDVHFLFIGEGPLKQKVIELKEEMFLSNLTLLDEIARENIADYISAADCCLVPLKNKPLFLGALPSKMFDFMACEKPVIVSVDGEAKRVVEESGAGIFAEPENTEQMTWAILRLKNSPEECRRMGKAGRAFVQQHFSRRQKALELESILQEIV